MSEHTTPIGVELHRSPCLCRPGAGKPGHVCVHRGTLWLRYQGQWWSLGQRSTHKTILWLDACESWADVIEALAPVPHNKRARRHAGPAGNVR